MPRRRSWVLVVLVCVLSLLSGCVLVERSQHGTDVDPLRLALVERGVSTKADVLRVLGAPSRKSVIQGREAWMYEYSAEENRVAFYLLYTERRKTRAQRNLGLLFADDVVYDYLFLE